MCNVSEQNVKWFVRYRAGRTEFAPFWRKNGSQSAIVNYNCPKLGGTHGTKGKQQIWKNWKFGQRFPYTYDFSKNFITSSKVLKSGILNYNFLKLGWTHGTEVTNTWLVFQNKMFNGLWDIGPDGQNLLDFDLKMALSRPFWIRIVRNLGEHMARR